ncbi:hypothetical protein IJI91_02445 [Candidatus Saccharibacteria bacterium]|nr:hypothetical protein [Candidatus Saccharibacteria bacterium]
MKKIKVLLGFGVFLGGLIGSPAVFAENTSPLTKEEQTVFSQNNIVFYEPCTDSGSGTNEDVGVLEGKDNKERVWNWFAKAGIKGVSDNPVVIAGIMGNLEAESGYNPFARNPRGYYGLYQTNSADMRSYVEGKVGPVPWGSSTDDAEKNSKTIAAELEWLEKNDRFKTFTKNLDAPSSKKGEAGAMAYAELFLVEYERAVCTSSMDCTPEPINDKGVANYRDKIYKGTAYVGVGYQNTSGRRNNAVEVYKYVKENNVGMTAGSSGATNSDVSSSLHDKAWELADQPGGEQGPTDAYLRAQEEAKCPSDCENHGQACTHYVATVVITSGVDSEFPYGAVNTQEDYMKAHPETYTLVEGDVSKEETYQPGDIRVKLVKDPSTGKMTYRKHIEIYGQREGKSYILSASQGDRWAGYANFSTDKNAEYHIYRTQGTPKCITNDGGCAQNSMDVVGTAICLAHPLGTDHKTRSFDDGAPTDNFKKAIDTVFPLSGERKNWNPRSKAGSSCDVGAATVVRYSGVDKKFDRGLDGQHEVKTNKKWELIKPASRSDLQPGDLAYWQNGDSGHVWIYLGKIGKKLYGAHAHYNGREYLGIEDSTTETVDWILRPKNAQNTTQITEEMLKNAGKDSVMTASDSSTTSSTSGGAQAINNSAIELAWPAGTSESKYSSGWNEAGGKYYKELDREYNQGGADCSEFGWTVLRHSGAVTEEENKKYPLTGDEDFKLFTEHPEKWEDLGKIKKSEYKPGDVLLWTKSQTHIAFYVEENGKKYIAEASHHNNYFGHLVKAYSGAERVFRYKGGGTTDNCDRCSTGDEDSNGDGTLKDGGFKSAKEAQAVVDAYNKANLSKLNPGLGSACRDDGDLHKNCVNFSKWFIATYLKGMNYKFFGNGGDIAQNFYDANKAKFPKIKESKVPVAYSIVSLRRGPLTGSVEGHTGVILGINGDQIIFGEAGYCSFNARITTLSVKQMTSHSYQKYIDINAYVGSGGLQ